jgi:predicted dehydrogenase
VDAGIPVFVDKPFCIDLDEGIEFVRHAREKGVPITSFSTLPIQQSVTDFAEAMKGLGKLRSIVTAGPGDVDDQYGGVFFYGIHQVDLLCTLLDRPAVQVTSARHGDDGVATVAFADGVVAVLNMLKDWWAGGFCATAYGDEAPGVHHSALAMDEDPYLTGVKRFCTMFETGEEPVPPRSYLRPVAILSAMQESFDSGRPVDVREVPEI